VNSDEMDIATGKQHSKTKFLVVALGTEIGHLHTLLSLNPDYPWTCRFQIC